MSKFLIKGPAKINGRLKPSGSKNAVLPIMAASLINKGTTILTNVPNISDVWTMIKIFEYLDSRISFENNKLTIDNSSLQNKEIPKDLVCQLRGAIVLLGPLLARFGSVKMSYPGGCIIGKRPIDTHLQAFQDAGCDISESNGVISIEKSGATGSLNITLKEISVTASENIISFAGGISNKSKIKLCAAEPHVQDLCKFMKVLGSKINGIGSHTLDIEGIENCNKNVEYKVTSDYLEIGTFAVATAITGGHLIIEDSNEDHLDSFWLKMKEAGVKFKHSENEVEIFPTEKLNPVNIKTGVFPAFATDLQAPFSLIQCKADGVSKIFETLFEKRLNYLFELEKMGVRIELLNPHQAMIIGGKNMTASEVSSCDLRAGAAMVLAALIADGETIVNNIYYIDRGYEDFDKKLQGIGVDIKRIK